MATTLHPLPTGSAGEGLAYPDGWELDAVLMDGIPIHIRPIRPEDADALRRFHGRLSPETIALRFFAPHPKLSDAEVERLTRVNYADRMALIGLIDGDLVAVARYERLPGTRNGEVAFVVQDDHQRRGIATLLLEHLAGYGRGRGLEHFTAEVLPGNHAMLDVFRNAGFGVTMRTRDGIVQVSLPLDPTPEAQEAMDERERRGEVASMTRLLQPRSLAVVGAGRHGGVGHAVMRNLLAAGFTGPVLPVNPGAGSVAGVLAYPSLSSLPGAPDLVVVAIPAQGVPGVVAEAADRGAAGVVILSAGFAEAGPGGAATERRISSLARSRGLRLVGPNCLGLANTDPAVRLDATFAPVPPSPGPVGFLSQSGAVGIDALFALRRAGLGLSSFVSVGNQADVSANDLLCYWESDPATKVVALYLESFGNPTKFRRIARRVARRKPVVAIKAGGSRAGARGARSHTAAAATPVAVATALLGQAGVIRARSLAQMIDVCALLVSQPLPLGPRVALVGNSGGPLVLAADACERAGLSIAELADRTRKLLRESLAPQAATGNPVDLTAGGTGSQLGTALSATLDDPHVDSVLAVVTPLLSLAVGDIRSAVTSAAHQTGKPVILALLGVDQAALASPVEPGSALLMGSVERAVDSLAMVTAYAAWRRQPERRPEEAPRPLARSARELARRFLQGHEDGVWLEGARAFQLARECGLPTIPTVGVTDVESAVQAAQHLGYPVALKSASPELVHKSEAGGVRLHLGTEADLREAWAEMAARLGERMGRAVVQPMGPEGLEAIVGLSREAAGPVVMVGLGGVATDLLGDRAFGLAPLSEGEAEELVASLRASPLLDGYRGSQPVDKAALGRLVAQVAHLGEGLPEVAEMDLNPVVVSSRGVMVLDVKLRLHPHPEGPGPGLRYLG